MPINIDEYLRHETYLARLASENINAIMTPALSRTYSRVRQLIAEGNIRTPLQLKRLVEQINKAIIAESGWPELTAEMRSLAEYEADFQAGFISNSTEQSLSVPSVKQVRTFVDAATMSITSGERVNTGVWTDFVDANLQSRLRQVLGIVRRGYSRQLPVSEIIRDVRQSVNGILLRETETLTRTGYQHFANQARAAMAEANPSVEMDVVFSAVFDNRTTLGCRALNGKRWPKGSPNIVEVPRHFNCRSSHLYLPSAEKLEGTRAAIGGQPGTDAKEAFEVREQRIRDAQRRRANEESPPKNLTKASREKYRGRKDSDIFKAGQVRASTSQDSWMRSQPAWFQDDALGPTRAKLLRSGEYDFNDFIDMSGRRLTINELKARDSEIFKRLGL